MTLTISKSDLIDSLLGPVSKISDNVCITFDGTSCLKTIVTSSDNSLVLLVRLPCTTDCSVKCVIPDCKTFLRLFSGITEDTLTLNIHDNYIEYVGKDITFKYHLLDESYVINKKSLSEDKINKLEFDTTFTISKRVFSEISKFHSILPDSEKLYFFAKDGAVSIKIGDEQKANTNQMTMVASTGFSGLPPTIDAPISIQNMLLMSFADQDIEVSVNHKLKVYKFKTEAVSYIAFGLVK